MKSLFTPAIFNQFSLWIVCLLSVTNALPEPQNQSRSGIVSAGYDEVGSFQNKTFYIMTNSKKNWHEAWESCRDAGLVLASVDNEEQSQFVSYYINVHGLVIYATWLSGSDLGNHEGSFYWMGTGKPLNFTNWARGQPDDGNTGESCIYGFGSSFLWMDLPCNSKTVSCHLCQTP